MINPPSSNPKLKTPLVVEAIFEIRFEPSSEDYSLFVGQIYHLLKGVIEKKENVIPEHFPDFKDIPQIIRHRFSIPTHGGLIQTGRGILSVNKMSYDTFTSFLDFISLVLDRFAEVEISPIIKRLGIRYINKIKFEKNITEVLNVDIKLPEVNFEIESENLRFVYNLGDLGKMQINITEPIKNGGGSKNVVLDFDCFVAPDKQMSTEKILGWVGQVHQNIFETFKATIEKDYWKKIL